ncbi:MAG: hypothetical protein H8D23_28585, partial [Candidatus Brocadiales bacterium]|nr:hypothetical protein [Candidatus Brocadiales bacterium]
MASNREQLLQLLNQSYQGDPNASPVAQATLENLNAQYEKDPGAFASQGILRDTMRLLGQVPTGFLEGFTTLETDFIPPRSEAEHIARSIGSLGGFIGYVPNPASLTAKAGLTLGARGVAERYIGKRAVSTLGRETIAQMSKKELAEQVALMGGTNVWKLGSVPMHGADLAMKFISPKVAPSLKTILDSTKFLKNSNRFLTVENVISTGKGAIHLGLASSIAATGINPFQWSERLQESIPSFLHGAVFGAGFKTIGNLGIAMKGMVVDGQPQLAIKIAQATAGALWQGLPATMRDATTSEQVYEYLLGAWFGFHEVPWTSQSGARKVNKISKDFLKGGPHYGASLYHVRNSKEDAAQFKKIHGKSFEEFYGIDAIRKNYIPEYAEAIEFYLNKAAALDPRAGYDNSGRQYAGHQEITDHNNQKIEVPMYWRNPYRRDDIERFNKVAQYDPESGSIIIDPFQLEPAVDFIQKNGFKPDKKGVTGFEASVLKDKYDERGKIRRFIINHEAYHTQFEGNENLATAVALAETLGKNHYKNVPEKLLESLDGASKLTYDEHIRIFDMQSATDANLRPGAEVVLSIPQKGTLRGKLLEIAKPEELHDTFESTYLVEYLDGERVTQARVPKSFFKEVLKPRDGEEVSTPQKDVKQPTIGAQEQKNKEIENLSESENASRLESKIGEDIVLAEKLLSKLQAEYQPELSQGGSVQFKSNQAGEKVLDMISNSESLNFRERGLLLNYANDFVTGKTKMTLAKFLEFKRVTGKSIEELLYAKDGAQEPQPVSKSKTDVVTEEILSGKTGQTV